MPRDKGYGKPLGFDTEKYLIYEEVVYVLCMSAQGLRNRWSKWGGPTPSSDIIKRAEEFKKETMLIIALMWFPSFWLTHRHWFGAFFSIFNIGL